MYSISNSPSESGGEESGSLSSMAGVGSRSSRSVRSEPLACDAGSGSGESERTMGSGRGLVSDGREPGEAATGSSSASVRLSESWEL